MTRRVEARPARRAAIAAVALVAVLAAPAGCGDDGGGSAGSTLPPDPAAITAASAAAMGEVTSVRFDLERDGAAVYIDPLDALRVDRVEGRFSAPASADAVLSVTVNDSIATELGAVALDGEVWLSNPVTGDFEPLPESYGIDPATFFDPVGGWRPLMAELRDVELVGTEDRDGRRYHVRGLAPAERMAAITAGLVDDQDVTIDFWLEPDTGLVRAAEFTTVFDGGPTTWALELTEYGEQFEIEAPALDG